MKGNIDNARTLPDGYYELALAKPVPDAEVLDDVVRRYPEHATGLTQFAIQLVLDSLRESGTEDSEIAAPEVTIAVSKAISRFHNRRHELSAASESRSVETEMNAENPFSSLPRSEIRALARRLNVNTVFLMRLRDRLVELETMTESFLQWLADGVGVSKEVLKTHFAASPQLQASEQYKADRKPTVGAKQTFEDAVRSSSMTPEQQEHLLNLR